MPLPNSSTTILPADPSGSRPAYSVRFPEDVWAQLEKSALNGASVSLSLDDGMHLVIGDTLIPLTSQPSGSTSEIHRLTHSPDTLTPYAVASSRLAFPPSANGRAVDRLKAQNEANEKERKDRVDRVNGLKKAKPPALDSAPLRQRTVGSPLVPPPASAGGSSTGGPIIPLKTRVVQLLALGPQSIEDIVSRVGMSENEVMRIVNVVGKETMDGYTLQPNKYAQVKIGPWKYTYAEKLRVIKLAKGAFDELGLPEDADERADLDRKESEVMSGGSGAAERMETPPPASIPAPLPPTSTTAAAPVASKKEKGKKTTGLGLIGKQRAKFAAEKQRASSLPNSKNADGTASPRMATSPLIPAPDTRDLPKVPRAEKPEKAEKDKTDSASKAEKAEKSAKVVKKEKLAKPEKTESKPVKRKRDDDIVAAPRRPPSPASTQSSEETRGRSKQAKPVTSSAQANGDESKKKGPRKSRDYSSSSEDEKGSRPLKFDRIPRKPPAPLAPPPTASLYGRANGPPDPEALRERYEELFPAYQLLSQKLAKIHRDAETEEEGQVVEMDEKELTKLVTRFEKWHRELEGIRKWFA